MLRSLLRAALHLGLGLILALGLLEAILRLNPTLLLRGMAAPAPLDAPLTASDYTLRYSDGDLFTWESNLIRPIAPGQDQVAARVHFVTDEFGFPNAGPLPREAALVVLGRSFSQGAQSPNPWPRQLSAATGLALVNLAQPGGGIDLKHRYLREFGFPRHPRWVILEVLPSLDILGYRPDAETVFESLPFPLADTLAGRLRPASAPAVRAEIYPLAVRVGPTTRSLVFFSHYLSALSIGRADIEASRDWANYQQAVLDLADDARAHGSCLALLYAPTKEELYFSAAADPRELTPALGAGWAAWRLQPNGSLAQDGPVPADAALMQAQAGAARSLVAEFAAAHQLAFADPTPQLQAAARSGDDPYLTYDTHWSAAGHTLVAGVVAQALRTSACP